jgi:type I restriction enzyme, R subunit
VLKQPLSLEESWRTFGDGFEDEQRPFEYLMDGGREITEQDRVLYALCRRDRLLDLARRFTLFDLGVKKVARYQQFFGLSSTVRFTKRLIENGD